MSANDWNWLLAIVGTVASIAGVIFSGLAWVQAKGAKKAAEEAVRTVRAKETVHDFSKMAADSKGLLEAVQTRQKEKAIIAATDLIHLLLFARDRRASYLPRGFNRHLSVEHLQIISNALASGGFPEDTPRIQKLLERCHEIHNSLCGIAATADRNSEEAK
jgi:hypothetical protein